MKRNIRKAVTALLLCVVTVLSALSFYGCTSKGLRFHNKDMCNILAQVFSKEVNRITEEDLADIESVTMLTYSQSNFMGFTLKGFAEAPDEEKDKYSVTVDITGMDLSDMSDFHYFTGLKTFIGSYVGYSSFDFLKSCTALEEFNITGNAACQDFSFLSAFPNLKTLSLTECQSDNLDFLEGHENLQALYLRTFRIGDNLPSDLEFVKSLPELTTLSVSSHWIEDLSPLVPLKKLTYLDLSYGSIEDVSPLAEMPQLTYIDLTQNCVRDVSALTTFDADSFERIILDLNSGITDWSALDYLNGKVQGKPTARELEEMQRENTADSNENVQSETETKNNSDSNDGEDVRFIPSQTDEDFEVGYGDNDIDISAFDF